MTTNSLLATRCHFNEEYIPQAHEATWLASAASGWRSEEQVHRTVIYEGMSPYNVYRCFPLLIPTRPLH
jgi:hypothetical protein